MIKDKRVSSLSILRASQTRDKDVLNKDNVGMVLKELAEAWDYIICDSPSGIEAGAMMALYLQIFRKGLSKLNKDHYELINLNHATRNR